MEKHGITPVSSPLLVSQTRAKRPQVVRTLLLVVLLVAASSLFAGIGFDQWSKSSPHSEPLLRRHRSPNSTAAASSAVNRSVTPPPPSPSTGAKGGRNPRYEENISLSSNLASNISENASQVGTTNAVDGPLVGTGDQRSRPIASVLSSDENTADGYCPELSSFGICDDRRTAAEVTTIMEERKHNGRRRKSKRLELHFRDATMNEEEEHKREASSFPDSSCQGRDDGFLAPNGVGYVGGTTGPCGNDKAAKQSGTKEFGDVDSFIVAVRHKAPKEKEEEKTAKLYRNEAFRLDVLRAQFKGASNDISSDYHSVLHATAGGEVHLYSVEERAAAAKMKAGVECTSWWCDDKTQDGGVTFAPLVVDAVVAHVDGSVPGFTEELSKAHVASGLREMCNPMPLNSSSEDRTHSWRREFRDKLKPTGKFSMNRWRDWGELRYCLRGVFTHGRLGGSEAKKPGFRYRRVFLVVNTVEHAPDWLRKRAVGDGKYVYEEQPGAEPVDYKVPLITIVPHSAFIPQCALPTYSALAIEPFLYRIPGLSRWFVYINDDTVVSRPMSFLDYFVPLPSVRQYAKVEALKRRHGEDVFAPVLGEELSSTTNTTAEVVLLELSLFNEHRVNARFALKKNGKRASDKPAHAFSLKHFAGEPVTELANMMRRRSTQYSDYLKMVEERLEKVRADDGADVAPLRPSAFFDIACAVEQEGRYRDEMARKIVHARGNQTRLTEYDFIPARLAPRGTFVNPDTTCFNIHLIFRKLDGADPYHYFPHMSPLFDARLLRRIIGAPYIGEDNSPGRVRGIFEEEFTGRAVFNPLRTQTDPIIPFLYQAAAATQRRYFTKVQLAAVPEVLAARSDITMATSGADRVGMLEELMEGVGKLKKAADKAAIPADRVTPEAIITVQYALHDAEKELANRMVRKFGVGYTENSEGGSWNSEPLPSNQHSGENEPASVGGIPPAPQQFVPCTAESHFKCDDAMRERLSLRPNMPGEDTSFYMSFFAATLRDIARKIRTSKKRPLFITLNDDTWFPERDARTATSQQDRDKKGTTVASMRAEYDNTLKVACGTCKKAPWEE